MLLLVCSLAFFSNLGCANRASWDRLAADWSQKHGFDPLVRYPPREANQTALEIEALLVRHGFGFAPAQSEDRHQPDEASAEQLKGLASAFRDYLMIEEGPIPRLDGLPRELDEAFRDMSGDLLQLREILLTSPAPEWELRLDEGLEAPLPNHLGHMYLHRFLLLGAVDAFVRGDVEPDRWLRSAAVLRRRLGKEPRLLSRLIALAEHRWEQAVHRRFETAPVGWRHDLQPLAFRQSMFEALSLDVWLLIRSGRNGTITNGLYDLPFYQFLALKGVEQCMESTDHALDRLRDLDLRTFDSERFRAEELSRIPGWNRVATHLLTSLLDAPVRAVRNELDLELTFHILESRERIAKGWNPEPGWSELRPSESVPGAAWRWTALEDQLRIELLGGSIPTAVKNPLPLLVEIAVPRSAEASRSRISSRSSREGRASGPSPIRASRRLASPGVADSNRSHVSRAQSTPLARTRRLSRRKATS